MEINEIKKILIETLNKIDHEKDYKKVVEDFINTYDGTNTEQFVALMQTTMFMIAHAQMLDAKSKGFDAMAENNETFNEDFAQMKRDFTRLSNDQEVEEPSQSA